MIPQSQISKLSNRLLKEQGGRRIPENILERDYSEATDRSSNIHNPIIIDKDFGYAGRLDSTTHLS